VTLAPSPAAPPIVVDEYDPAGYISGDTTTYPPLPPGVFLYQPGMSWLSIGTGVVEGANVVPGDYLFAVPLDRPYGDLTFGELIYGSTGPDDWIPALTSFIVWEATLPPELQPPFPYSGCPFTRDDLPGGDWAPGWRIVIDSFFLDLTGTRTYGLGGYGDDVYGDENGGVERWADITRPHYSVSISAGNRDGSDQVDVDTIELELHDDTGEWVDFAEPGYYYTPFVGDPIRVGLVDPTFKYHPMAVGQLELISDEHDRLPRMVTMQAFGNAMDLVVDIVGWTRPAETASARIRELLNHGWRYGDVDVVYPAIDPPLNADELQDITVRNEIDRTCTSAGWQFDTDRWGLGRIREWPVAPEGPALEVVDCNETDDPAVVVSNLIEFIADQSQLLNRAMYTNDEETRVTVQAVSDSSVARYGPRGRALGFPKSGLSFADSAHMASVATRAVQRHSLIVRRVDRIEADTAVDHGWLAHLVDLDSGRAVHVTRHHIAPFELDALVVGFDHEITPGNIRTAIATTTLTPT
jgi:hypothetical protein